jgi:phosphatidylglycerol:prolipoprotein diacylglycerol transferase
MVAYGGFLGGTAGAAVFLRRRKASLLAFCDACAPPLCIGLGLVRVGCYLYGCDFGVRLSDSAPDWLKSIGTFPHSTTPGLDGPPAWSRHVDAYGLSPLADSSLPVPPTQLYESVVGFLLAGAAFFVWSRRQFRGQVVLTVAMLYGVWRFIIEFVRDDPARGFQFGLSTSQLISVALVPACGFLYMTLRKRHLASPEAEVSADAEGEPEPKPDAGQASKPERKKRKRRKKRH